MNLSLYFITVLIWGTTWIAIKWQVGVVAPPVSIAFRFWLAALVMFVLMRLLRRSVKAPREVWPLLAGQGVALFCVNFLCFYYAEQIVPSGLVAVVFSTAPLLNAINGRIFMGRPLQPSAIVGAVLGLVGILCLFAPQMAGHTGDRAMWLGLAITLAGTMSFSAGNLFSSRMQAMGLHPTVTNSWAMLIGAGCSSNTVAPPRRPCATTKLTATQPSRRIHARFSMRAIQIARMTVSIPTTLAIMRWPVSKSTPPVMSGIT